MGRCFSSSCAARSLQPWLGDGNWRWSRKAVCYPEPPSAVVDASRHEPPITVIVVTSTFGFACGAPPRLLYPSTSTCVSCLNGRRAAAMASEICEPGGCELSRETRTPFSSR